MWLSAVATFVSPSVQLHSKGAIGQKEGEPPGKRARLSTDYHHGPNVRCTVALSTCGIPTCIPVNIDLCGVECVERVCAAQPAPYQQNVYCWSMYSILYILLSVLCENYHTECAVCELSY